MGSRLATARDLHRLVIEAAADIERIRHISADADYNIRKILRKLHRALACPSCGRPIYAHADNDTCPEIEK